MTYTVPVAMAVPPENAIKIIRGWQIKNTTLDQILPRTNVRLAIRSS
jgi:hypothetical protein